MNATRAARLRRHAAIASSLANLSDRELHRMVDEIAVVGSGIGGIRKLLLVDGIPVFVKCVPLTDLERRPENVMSTANMFDLPLGCQYGVGSPSFGAWRELAANAMTTGWVLAGESDSFLLMHHWRVLDGLSDVAAKPEELANIEGMVEYWHGCAAMRQRLEAIAQSTAMVTLFLEYIPQGLTEWLEGQVARDADAAAAAIEMVEHSLRSDVAFMNAGGLFHFDAHFGNIRTDGERLYFADFGLATSPQFELSAAESSFLATNISHDACHTITRLVDWLVTELTCVPDPQARDEFIRRTLNGDELIGLFPSAAAIIKRYAPIAVVINEFYRKLHLEDRTTPYPVAEIKRACAAAGFEMPWLS
jgi:hypothetical protein